MSTWVKKKKTHYIFWYKITDNYNKSTSVFKWWRNVSTWVKKKKTHYIFWYIMKWFVNKITDNITNLRLSLRKSEFFFFSSFFRYLCNGKSSGGPTLISSVSPLGLFTTRSTNRERPVALRKAVLLRHVTSRHVTFCDSQFIQQQEDTLVTP